MKTLWENVKANDVKKAIQLFDHEQEDYPQAKNTFLIYKGKRYPAKHIRGIAYSIANKKEILKNEYSGGNETANFFKKLGFDVEYNKELNINDNPEFVDENSPSKSSVEYHKIARIILTDKEYPKNGSYSKIQNVIKKFVTSNYGINHFEFIVTPGGFLKFNFPETLQIKLDIEIAEKEHLIELQNEAEKTIDIFFNDLSDKLLFDKLSSIADYITIGIDGYSQFNQSIQLVAIYDFNQKKVIRWTGKFYPLQSEASRLVKVNDIDTHFIKLNGQNVVVLGCHDINVFSPRGQAVAAKDGWRKKTADGFKQRCTKNNPSIILHHPHRTDSDRIWNLSWKQIEKDYPKVKHYASGVHYPNNPRQDIEKVLEKTKKGDVVDFNYTTY